MNREQRRNMEKSGGALQYLNTHCTIAEAAQIARGVSEDVVADCNHQKSHLQVAVSLQIEILKDAVIRAGIMSEEEFFEMYMKKAEEFNKRQQEMASEYKNNNNPKMQMSIDDIEVTSEG